MSTRSEHGIQRNLVVQRWGTPDVTIGSLNEPRVMEENGVSFNEKWIYRGVGGDPQRPCERVIYWQRYDFVASMQVAADGTPTREDPAALLTGLSARLYRPLDETPDA